MIASGQASSQAPKPALVQVAAFTTRLAADQHVARYRATREQRRAFVARLYQRDVRADGAATTVWVVVVRERGARQ